MELSRGQGCDPGPAGTVGVERSTPMAAPRADPTGIAMIHQGDGVLSRPRSNMVTVDRATGTIPRAIPAP